MALKFHFTGHAIRGKSVVIVDDSIVRGTTLTKVIAEIRRYEPREVHVRSGTPMIKYPCVYGIDMQEKERLIAATHTNAEICKKLGADSVEFLPLDVQKQMSPNPESFCFACMDGRYWH